MRVLVPTSRYKKDLKRYAHDSEKIKALYKILKLLAEEKPIPQSHKPHFLKGEYKGCMECHIGNDFLLIWIDDNIVELVRLGSHSELFK